MKKKPDCYTIGKIKKERGLRMKKIHRAVSLTLISIICLLTVSCFSKKKNAYEPTENGIYISRKGKILGAEVGPLDKQYYSGKELKEFAGKMISDYNKEKGFDAAFEEKDKEKTLPVVLVEALKDKKTGKLLMAYKSVQDYMEFRKMLYPENPGTVFALTAFQPDKAEALVNLEGNKVDASSIREKNLRSLKIDFAIEVQVEGKILYHSPNVEVVNDHTVKTPDGQICQIVFES